MERNRSSRGGPRFSLRTLLVVMALVSLAFGWVGYSLNWIRQRDKMLLGQPVLPPWRVPGPFGRVPAPAWLGLFGEEGVAIVCWYPGSPFSVDQAQRLFPEAEIVSYTMADVEDDR